MLQSRPDLFRQPYRTFGAENRILLRNLLDFTSRLTDTPAGTPSGHKHQSRSVRKSPFVFAVSHCRGQLSTNQTLNHSRLMVAGGFSEMS